MDAIAFVIAAVLGLAALFAYVSRNKLAGELDQLHQSLESAKAEAAAARKDAERRAQDKKGRGEELASARGKINEAKRRLRESQEAEKQARDLALARTDEVRELEGQIALMREDASGMADELRRFREETERPRGRRREEPAPAPAVMAPPPAPVSVDERLVLMGREVESYKGQASEAEHRRVNAERQAIESRKQADEAREEVKRARGRAEANNRVYLVTRGEAELWKAKYGTLEQRWNQLWRELEGIGWRGRTTRDLNAPLQAANAGEGRRNPRGRSRGPRGGAGQAAIEGAAPGATVAGPGSAAAEMAPAIQTGHEVESAPEPVREVESTPEPVREVESAQEPVREVESAQEPVHEVESAQEPERAVESAPEPVGEAAPASDRAADPAEARAAGGEGQGEATPEPVAAASVKND